MPAHLFVALALGIAGIVGLFLSRRTGVPVPCFLVVAGVAVSFAPGVTAISLPPEVVFYGFLPPLLYSAAFFTAPREVRLNWLPILALAVGLTAASTVAVAGAAWGLAGVGAGAAFVLGAVLGPTDPVSATAVLGSSSAPDRLRTILEGESLVNDGVGLVVFAVALSAVETGRFSVAHGLLKFVELSAGGCAIGIAVGAVVRVVRTRIHDAEIEIPISLLTPYLAYLPAQRAGVSGVLAAVACGVYLGWRSEGIFLPTVRVQSRAFWDALSFLLSSILFVLLGMQFRPVLARLPERHWPTLVAGALVVFAAVVVVRLLWMATVPHLVRLRGADVDPWRDRLVLGWSGMRGALSLAAALSIPASVTERPTILFLAFTTIVATIIVLGVPLPWLLRRLGFASAAVPAGELETRRALAEAALRKLDELDDASGDAAVGGLRRLYESRRGRLGEAEAGTHYRELRRVLLEVERRELRRLEQEGAIGFAAAREIERELDHEEAGLRPH